MKMDLKQIVIQIALVFQSNDQNINDLNDLLRDKTQ